MEDVAELDKLLDSIIWDEEPVQGLELPGLPDLEASSIPHLSTPAGEHSVNLPLDDLARMAFEAEHDYVQFQLHKVVTFEGVSVLMRWHTEPPKILVPFDGEVVPVTVADLPAGGGGWLRDQRDLLAESLAPIVGWFWPVRENQCDAEDLAVATRGLPVVVVEFGDLTGFAITAICQDLSTDIAEAFVRCGYLPPVSLTRPDVRQSPVAEAAWVQAVRNDAARANAVLLTAEGGRK